MKRFGKIRILILGLALVALAVPYFLGQQVTANGSIAVSNPAAFPFETNLCLDDASGATCSAAAAALGWPFPTSFRVPTMTSGHVVGRLVINYVAGQLLPG